MKGQGLEVMCPWIVLNNRKLVGEQMQLEVS